MAAVRMHFTAAHFMTAMRTSTGVIEDTHRTVAAMRMPADLPARTEEPMAAIERLWREDMQERGPVPLMAIAAAVKHVVILLAEEPVLAGEQSTEAADPTAEVADMVVADTVVAGTSH